MRSISKSPLLLSPGLSFSGMAGAKNNNAGDNLLTFFTAKDNYGDMYM